MDKPMCRICLRKHEKMCPLYGRQKEESRSHLAGLRKLGVNISLTGPKSICYECLKELEAALNFVEKCKQSNRTLLGQSNKSVPTKNNSVKSIENDKLLKFKKTISDANDVSNDCIGLHTNNKGLNKKHCPNPGTTHTCHICQKVFNRKFNFKLHLQRHSGDFDWACPKCGVRVVTRWLALRHCGPRPRRACPEPGCGKTYTTQYNLATHMRAHTGERPFECSECGKKFTSKNTLTDHIRIHTGVKPYICPECGKRFTTNKLSVHMWSHRSSAARALACPRAGCARRFPSPRALALHARSHRAPPAAPAPPHACRHCAAAYHHKQSLNKHIRKRHCPPSTLVQPDAGDAEPNNKPQQTEQTEK